MKIVDTGTAISRIRQITEKPYILLLCACLLPACSHNMIEERAERGDADAQFQLATQSQNKRDAVYWYQQSAAQGNAAAQNNLGVMYRKGSGVEQNFELARHWFAEAASRGHHIAEYNLGYLYEQGLGVSQDYSQAMEWYLKAGFKGVTKAQYRLGNMYHLGLGVPEDMQKAYSWAALAALEGDVEARKLRDKVAMLLNLEDLVEAQQEASEWYEEIKGKNL
jgi:TPR repeat protein